MSQIVTVGRGQGVDYYDEDGHHLASAVPPRPHDAWYQWRALDCEGRAVEVNNRGVAMGRAEAYAQEWIARSAALVVP
jgi:hypothetical protein